MDDDLFMLLCR